MVTLSFSICLLGFSLVSSQRPASSSASPADTALIEQFAAAVSQYLAFRVGVTKEVPGLRVTDDPREIASRSDALAGAIQRGRGNAPQGQFFNAKLVDVLRRRLRDIGARPDIRAEVMPEGDEKSTVGAVRVHTRFPGASPMATVPTVLLDALPPLPRELEYRFIGTTLVLRDIEAALILDYAPGVLPPGPRK
jgi:hypothetical protein